MSVITHCFKSPSGVAIGADHTIYVTDATDNCVQCFDRSGKFIQRWGSSGNQCGELAQPEAIATGISEKKKKLILAALTAAPDLSTFPSCLLTMCIQYFLEEDVYVADSGNDRIQVFNGYGTFRRMWGGKGDAEGRFRYPGSCAFCERDGLFYVGDDGNSRVQVFDSDGLFVRKWGDASMFSEDDSIGGLAMSIKHECIYVTESNIGKIYCYRMDGTFERTLLTTECLECPWGIALDEKTDTLYVADFDKNCIIIMHNDEVIGHLYANVLNRPSAIALKSNILYVVDSDNTRVVVINLSQ